MSIELKVTPDAWTLRKREEQLLARAETRMLWWIPGQTLKDIKRNADIRKAVGVANITDKVREARLRWQGHVKRKEEYGGGSLRSQKTRTTRETMDGWSEGGPQSSKANRERRRQQDRVGRRTHAADQSPKGYTA